MRFNVFPSFPLYRALMNTHLQSGPALAGAGPNARPRRGAPLTSGVITSSRSVNRVYKKSKKRAK